MTNVVDFKDFIVKETEPIFKAGSVVAAKVGSPNMLVLLDSGEAVEVIYIGLDGNPTYAVYPVDEVRQVYKEAVVSKSGHWDNEQ